MLTYMSPMEYRRIVRFLGLTTHKAVADAIGVKSHATAMNYAKGATPVPGPVAKLLREWVELRKKSNTALCPCGHLWNRHAHIRGGAFACTHFGCDCTVA